MNAICHKFRNFADANTTWNVNFSNGNTLRFAEIYVPLLVQLQHFRRASLPCSGCDLLKFMYLCWCSYNHRITHKKRHAVVICWNLCTFAGAVTTTDSSPYTHFSLWFAEIYVPLLVQLQQECSTVGICTGCDLLKFMYLCWCSYNSRWFSASRWWVVICWNLCTFAGAVTTCAVEFIVEMLLWFAEIYVPLLVQLQRQRLNYEHHTVVICWNLCTFAGAVTTFRDWCKRESWLWFAEIYVPLLVQLQP